MDFVRSPDPPGWLSPDRFSSGWPSPGRLWSGPAARRPPVPVKIIVSGAFGVGKTTTVRSISEIAPLTTEAEMTSVAVGIDESRADTLKTTTTVAMDFGCVTWPRSAGPWR